MAHPIKEMSFTLSISNLLLSQCVLVFVSESSSESSTQDIS